MAPTEESFALPISSASEAKFDAVVGSVEAIIMDPEFQVWQRNFMDKYYQEFEDTEENKLTYTPIFNEYLSWVEKYIEEQLLEHPSQELLRVRLLWDKRLCLPFHLEDPFSHHTCSCVNNVENNTITNPP
uniref:ADP-ribosylation factor-like protein 2-binding protein n=1 Tax=Colobus angolensis palliatus TaxID=336983 RepID=A0A2K5IG49_COLAP